MTTLDFAFPDRPVVSIRGRRYVLLDDLQPVIGVQLLAAADVTALMPASEVDANGSASVPTWYDGSGVCYVRPGSGAPARVGVIDLPMWVAPGLRGGVAQITHPA